jgi:hypothetical protein
VIEGKNREGMEVKWAGYAPNQMEAIEGAKSTVRVHGMAKIWEYTNDVSGDKA